MLTYKAAHFTEVYVSEMGYFCLAQRSAHLQEDQIITLTPDQVRWLINTATKLLPMAEQSFNADDEDDEYAIEA
jgi:hypothetical protein